MRFIKTVATSLVLCFAAAPALAAPGLKDPFSKPAPRAVAKSSVKDPFSRSSKLAKAGQGKRFERAGISKQKAEQIKKAMEKFKAQEKAIRDDMQKQRAALQKLLKADSNDQAAYKKALDAMAANQKKRAALKDSRQKELAKILTPKEMAKLLGAGRGGRGGGKAKGKGRRGGNGDFEAK